MFLKTGTYLACAMICATAIARADANTSPQSPPSAAVADSTQKALAANYALFCTAALDPNDDKVAAAIASLSPEFVDIDIVGARHTREEFVASTKDQFRSMHDAKCDNAFASITAPDPDTVVIVQTQNLSGDTQASDGKHRVEYSDTSEDTWKLENGGWLQTQTRDLHIVVKVDGSVIHDSQSDRGMPVG
jgi:hypothetical protein